MSHAGSARRRAGRRVLLVAIALFAAGSAYPSAFSVNELGIRAAGLGTAFVAVADDGSALFYNPAGIAFQPGIHMQMDNLVVAGQFRFTPSITPEGTVVPPRGYSGAIKPHFIPIASMYATMEYSKKMTMGLGIFTPFGLSDNFTNFNDGDPASSKFTGRFAGTRARLESFWFQPTVAYKVTPNLAIGLGPAFVHTHLMLEQSIFNPEGDGLTFGRQAANTVFPGQDPERAAKVISRMLPEGRSRIAGTSNSPAFAAGILYKNPHTRFSVGFSFRSAVTNHLSGKASFAIPGGYTLEQYIGSDFLYKAFPNQAIRGAFTTPATYSAGIAAPFLKRSRVSFDVRLQDYRRFASVPLNFGINSSNTSNVALPAEQRLVFNFRNSWHVAAGVEKKISENMTVRGGYLYDRSPVPDQSVGPLFPDSSRNSITFGASRMRGAAELSFFYEAMMMMARTTDVAANKGLYTNGLYDNFVHLGGISMRFEGIPFLHTKKGR